MKELGITEGAFLKIVAAPAKTRPNVILKFPHGEGWTRNCRVLDRKDVVKLYDWLGQWLGEDPTPEQPATPAPLTAADVRAIASEVVAEALAQRAAPEIRNGAAFCRIPGCMLFPGTAEHFEHDPEPTGWDAKSLIHVHDPEPRDVGHPGPVTLAEALADPTPAGLDTLWSKRAVCKAVPKPGVLLLSPCPDCGFVWLLHPTAVASQGITCKLCGAPWSDGHGQPGDPCTGAPKQLVGCECGHRWGVHSVAGCGKYTGVLNETRCTCTRTPPSAPEVQQ